MTRPRLPLVLLSAACLAVAVGCGSEERVATVNGERITQEEVESLIELYKGRAEAREGEGEEAGKETVSHAQELGALQVLVQREELAQKADELGVSVDDEAVEELAERLEGTRDEDESEEGEGEEGEGEEKDVREQIEETARAQLLYQALARRVARDVHVPREAVIAYYRSHRASYPAPPPRPGNLPPPAVEATIRRGLVATARDQAMARFVARVRRELDPEVEYADGWSPRGARR